MKKFLNIIVLFTASLSFSQSDTIYIDGMECISKDSMEVTLSSFAIEDTGTYFAKLDTNYKSYALPATFEKPKNWLEARKEHERYGNSYPDTWKLETALSIIDTATNFGQLMSAKSWCLNHYSEVFPQLVARLAMKKKVGLENTADLIIWERVRTGDLPFYGHGGGMIEDIFTIAGRASWILNEITGEDFAIVGIYLTEKQAKDFKNRWVAYINKLK